MAFGTVMSLRVTNKYANNNFNSVDKDVNSTFLYIFGNAIPVLAIGFTETASSDGLKK